VTIPVRVKASSPGGLVASREEERPVLLDRRTDAPGQPADNDLATLRLLCLVRAGDGYLIRAVGELTQPGTSRRHIDISFGDAADRCGAHQLESVVAHIQRWCDDGTPVALVESGDRLALRAQDGTEVDLPRCA
jgi:hypothetical protein